MRRRTLANMMSSIVDELDNLEKNETQVANQYSLPALRQCAKAGKPHHHPPDRPDHNSPVSVQVWLLVLMFILVCVDVCVCVCVLVWGIWFPYVNIRCIYEWTFLWMLVLPSGPKLELCHPEPQVTSFPSLKEFWLDYYYEMEKKVNAFCHFFCFLPIFSLVLMNHCS